MYLYPYAPPFADVILNVPDFFGATGPTEALSVEITVPLLSRISKLTEYVLGVVPRFSIVPANNVWSGRRVNSVTANFTGIFSDLLLKYTSESV